MSNSKACFGCFEKRSGHAGSRTLACRSSGEVEKGGVVEVYRGEKCANEELTYGNGPCGPGEHYSAAFQWGILVSGVLDTDADNGLLGTLTDGDIIFDSSKNRWQLPAQVSVGRKQ